jgi:hypothetical protein|tara:strand:- start:23 stop:277 length:255 start_codon:yes stop_codon:yes gene_type:complete
MAENGTTEARDFIEFNKLKATQMLEFMQKDFDERVKEHYSMYTAFIKKLEDRDKTIVQLSDHVRKAHIKIENLERMLKELKHGS